MSEIYESEKNNNGKIILYSTGCPKCNVLKDKLNRKNIIFDEVSDKNEMIKKEIVKVPVLEVNGELMDFVKANDWVNNQ